MTPLKKCLGIQGEECLQDIQAGESAGSCARLMLRDIGILKERASSFLASSYGFVALIFG